MSPVNAGAFFVLPDTATTTAGSRRIAALAPARATGRSLARGPHRGRLARARGVAALTIAAALACGCSGSGTITPRFDPDGSDFFRTPWPSDHRTLPDGTVDLRDFPDADTAYLAAVRAAIEGEIVGFSTMPVGYFELDRDPGDSALPAAADTLDASASVQLVAVGAGRCGTRVPVQMQVSREEDRHLRLNVLAIAPVPGFVLEQAAPYAFLVNRNFGEPAGLHTARPASFDALLDPAASGPIADSLAPLRNCAASGAIDLSEVAIATVFTTQDVLGPARALRDAARDPNQTAAPALNGWAVDPNYSDTGYTSYTATYDTPIFQRGTSPYASGGGMDFEGGRPLVQRWETVPMIVIVPDGAGPFPVVLWVDGTGWGQWGHVSGRLTQELLAAGFAVASYMPQFHGDRASPGSNPSTHTYNFSNPEAGRNVLRQQIADTGYFIRVLEQAVPQLNSPPPLDSSRLLFGGQSQGAQNGALMAAVEPDLHGYVLNGLASYLTITILERKDGVDFEVLLKAVLNIGIDIDRFYPVLQIMQLAADSVDTHNYTAGWHGWAERPAGSNLFVLNGQADQTTDPVGINAMTIAGDLAPIDPPGWNVDPENVWARRPEPLPIVGNRIGLDGQPHTLATYLDPNTGHYTIYDRPAERARAIDFLLDARVGVPAIRP